MKLISNKLRIRFLNFLLHKVYKINQPDNRKCGIYEGIFPIHEVPSDWGAFKLFCPSRMVFNRARSFFTKEPETVNWISTFRPEDTLLDVGATVGLYSLLAAKRGAKVVAFEPEPQNFAVLTRNVYINGLSDMIVPLNLAISNGTRIDFLYMPVVGIGNAFNQFGVPTESGVAEAANSAKQFVMAYTLDAFLATFPQFSPNHIKIDVDGLEHLVIFGADKSLENPAVKSLLVEFDFRLEGNRQAIDFIKSKGFKIVSENQRIEQGFFNYIFQRP